MCAPLVGRILTFDPFAAEIPAFVEQVGKLDDLLIQSPLLSLHLPLSAQTRGLLGARELALLPDGAVVVNVARGGILDENALAGELNSGRLGGAGLDVFAEEPLPGYSPLLSTPNTILSPHVAGYSERSSWRLASWTIEDVLGYLASSSIEHGKSRRRRNGAADSRPLLLTDLLKHTMIPLLQQLAGHDHALDLVGALVDLGDRGPAGSSRR